jgi:hypothetical protein
MRQNNLSSNPSRQPHYKVLSLTCKLLTQILDCEVGHSMSTATRKRKISSDAAPSDHSSGIEQNFVGVTVQEDDSGAVTTLSCRSRRDKDRWETMPSLDCFPTLEHIDLHQCRYIESLHESITQLRNLQTLNLTGCSRLKSLPDAIGSLEQLETASVTIY